MEFLDGERLSGEASLADEEVFGREYTQLQPHTVQWPLWSPLEVRFQIPTVDRSAKQIPRAGQFSGALPYPDPNGRAERDVIKSPG